MLSWYGQIGLILYKDAFKKLMLVFSRGGMSLRFVCRDVDFFFCKVVWNNRTGIWTIWWCSEFWKEYLCQGLLLSPSGKGKWEQFFKGGLKLSPKVLHNIRILYDGEPQSFMHYICIEIYMQCIYKLKFKYIHGSPKEK